MARFGPWEIIEDDAVVIGGVPAGFAAVEVLFNQGQSVKGVATGNSALCKDGEPTDHFQPGMELHPRYTIFAEGARSHLGRQIITKYQLDAGRDAQSQRIDIKEL